MSQSCQVGDLSSKQETPEKGGFVEEIQVPDETKD